MTGHRTYSRTLRRQAKVGLFAAAGMLAAMLPTSSVGAQQSNAAVVQNDADFAELFQKFEELPEVEVPARAVDISEIEPPIEAEAEEVAATGRPLGSGMASYYGRKFHGRPTASGERFDMNGLTAAHKTLPFGTKRKVTNASTGRSVVVRVNDRGPFVRGRTIDLSRAAAEKIGLIARGHALVNLEQL